LVREEELKQAQLSEKHQQQRQAFMSRVKQQLKDIRAHYASLHAQQPKPVGSSGANKTAKRAPVGKQAPVADDGSYGTMMIESTARHQPTSGVDNDLGTVMFATSEFATSIIGGAGDGDGSDAPASGDSFADSFDSATIAPARDADADATPSFADSFDTVAPRGAKAQDDTPAAAAAADDEPDFASSFDTVVLPSSAASAPAAAATADVDQAAANAKPDVTPPTKQSKKSNANRSSLSLSASAVERLPDGWVEVCSSFIVHSSDI
jgi:hypothetical protein